MKIKTTRFWFRSSYSQLCLVLAIYGLSPPRRAQCPQFWFWVKNCSPEPNFASLTNHILAIFVFNQRSVPQNFGGLTTMSDDQPNAQSLIKKATSWQGKIPLKHTTPFLVRLFVVHCRPKMSTPWIFMMHSEALSSHQPGSCRAPTLQAPIHIHDSGLRISHYKCCNSTWFCRAYSTHCLHANSQRPKNNTKPSSTKFTKLSEHTLAIIDIKVILAQIPWVEQAYKD